MVKNHLKSIAAPRDWALNRKEYKWAVKPLAGKHPLNDCISINFVIKKILNYAKTTKEVKKILNDGNFIVDKKQRKDYKFALGLMDVIEIPKLNEFYRVLHMKDGSLGLVAVENKETNLKLLKVIRKKVVKNGKMQLTFHDGRNILLDKFDGSVWDTAIFDLSTGKILKYIKLDKGNIVYFSGGTYKGLAGKVKDLVRQSKISRPMVIAEIDGKDCTTLMEYAFVVGKDKSEVKLNE